VALRQHQANKQNGYSYEIFFSEAILPNRLFAHARFDFKIIPFYTIFNALFHSRQAK
jgi:hypothetical protein